MPPIPSFYTDYVNTRMTRINEIDTIVGNHGVGFSFITDLHDQDRHYSTPIAKLIQTNSSVVNKTVYGGDYINEPSSYETAINQLTERVNAMIIDDFTIFLGGNHDTNPYGTGAVSVSTLQTLLCSHLDDSITTNNKLYFYEDDLTHKVRYIYLYTGEEGTIDTDQVTWFSNAINLTSDWTVIIISHMALAGQYNVRTSNDPYGVVTSLSSIINNAVPTIACWIAGHDHIDIVNDTMFSFPIILCTCDAHGIQSSAMSTDTRVEGTINEQSFNVFHVDTTNRRVYMTRIGGGQYNVIGSSDLSLNDRVFTY